MPSEKNVFAYVVNFEPDEESLEGFKEIARENCGEEQLDWTWNWVGGGRAEFNFRVRDARTLFIVKLALSDNHNANYSECKCFELEQQ